MLLSWLDPLCDYIETIPTTSGKETEETNQHISIKVAVQSDSLVPGSSQ